MIGLNIRYIKKNMILFMCPKVAIGRNLVFVLKDYGFEIVLGEQNMQVPHNILNVSFLLVKTWKIVLAHAKPCNFM